MVRWVTFTAAVLAVAPAAVLAQGPLSSFFTNLLDNFDSRDNYEGAPYTIVKSTGAYEERLYPAKKWVCTEGQGRAGEDIGNGMFMKLFRYIQGGNARGESIKMTVPVSTQVTQDASSQIVTHRMCFYIGETHQANPPQPSNQQVFIENRPAMTIFTRMQGGYMSDADWVREANALSNILTNAGESYNTASYWRVGYDSPMKFWDRRNEVWLSKN